MDAEQAALAAIAAAEAARAAEQAAAETERTLNEASRIVSTMKIPNAVQTIPEFNGNPIKLHTFLQSFQISQENT